MVAELGNDAELPQQPVVPAQPLTQVPNQTSVGVITVVTPAVPTPLDGDIQQASVEAPVTEAVIAPVDIAATGLVRIPRVSTSDAPNIDGKLVNYLDDTEQLAGEWRAAVQTNDRGEPLSIDQLMFQVDGSFDGAEAHHWAAMHDGEYLYLLIVIDDAGNHWQDTDELRKPWKDDSIELFFDGNNSQLDQYDAVDDFHFTVNLQSTLGVNNSSSNSNAMIRQSDTSATLPSDLSFIAGPQRGPFSSTMERGRKDIYEFRIKLSELNIQMGSLFGIEFQFNDDDNGGSRDRKWAWAHPQGSNADNDYTWQNPSMMGRAMLMR